MKRNILLALVALCATAASPLMGQVWNKKTKVTFSGPVQIPAPHSKAGVMTLTAGSYVFKLVDSQSNRNIVQVTNSNENKVYSTILAINDYRLSPTSKTIIYFSERAAGQPLAIKSWFYPGDNFGQRFVYPKVAAPALAASLSQPVPSYNPPEQSQPGLVEREKLSDTPVALQTPAREELAYAPQALEKYDAADTNGEDGEPVAAASSAAPSQSAADGADQSLPSTASPIYGYGLAGAILLGGSLVVRRIAEALR
jgi:hypothetical protein